MWLPEEGYFTANERMSHNSKYYIPSVKRNTVHSKDIRGLFKKPKKEEDDIEETLFRSEGECS